MNKSEFDMDDIYILTIHSHDQFEGLFSTPRLAMRYVYLMCIYRAARRQETIERIPKQIYWRWNGGKRWVTDVQFPTGKKIHYEIRGGAGWDNAWGGTDYLEEFAKEHKLQTFEEMVTIEEDRNHATT